MALSLESRINSYRYRLVDPRPSELALVTGKHFWLWLVAWSLYLLSYLDKQMVLNKIFFYCLGRMWC